MNEEILRAVRQAVEAAAQGPIPMDDEASLFDSGVLDSFGLMNVVAQLEVSLNIRIESKDVTPRRFDSVSRIVAFCDTRR